MHIYAIFLEATLPALAFAAPKGTSFLKTAELGPRLFGDDAAWYEANVPFLDCADPEIAAIYPYRWRLYKAHLRNLGTKGWLVTEFLDDVGWQKQPYAMINAATPFHLAEGRWMRDRRPMDAFVDYLYAGAGNDRRYSEAIAAATYGYAALAKGDPAFAARYLPAMEHVYNLWDDRYDFERGLYWVEPVADATEYTISALDATGGKGGMNGGQAYRPTINSYQYANALAISRLARFLGDGARADDYATRAARLKANLQRDLWNEALAHFTDRYYADNAFVRRWDFVRGRELEGYVPWTWGLPDDDPKYAAAWRHLLDPNRLGGAHGMRTVEPSYEHYMRQYRYLDGKPECQWNGPAWPYQETQALVGIANLLNDYHQDIVHPADYLRLLRQYTRQHFLDGRPDLQEDYDPDTGRVIVGMERSHHYNHSGYVDLVVTGLCGLRPRADDTLEVNPLVDDSLPHFLLENAPYHGHAVTILWDRDGKRYGRGAGLSVYVDGRRRSGPRPLGRVELPLGRPIVRHAPLPVDTAVNVYRQGYPTPSASSDPERARWRPLDGRAWYFPEVPRGWVPEGTGESWYALDYGREAEIRRVRLGFFGDGTTRPPERAVVQVWKSDAWREVAGTATPKGNTETELELPAVKTTRLRIVFHHTAPMRLVTLSTY